MESVEYPQFNALCQKISLFLDNDSAISKSIQNELKKAKESLAEVKLFYFHQLVLYSHLKDVLLEHCLEQVDETFQELDDKKFYSFACEVMGATEAQGCLQLTTKPNSADGDDKLFGLTKEDFQIEHNVRKRVHQNFQQLLIPTIEATLKKSSIRLFKFWDPANKDSDKLLLAKAHQLSSVLSDEKVKLKRVNKLITENDRRYKALFEETYEKILASIVSLQEEISNHEQPDNDLMNSNADWLEAKCVYVLNKIRTMRNHLYAETYTPESSAALQQIRDRLSEAKHRVSRELEKSLPILSMYESVGDTFTQMLEEYTQLTIQLDNKKWALTELNKNKVIGK